MSEDQSQYAKRAAEFMVQLCNWLEETQQYDFPIVLLVMGQLIGRRLGYEAPTEADVSESVARISDIIRGRAMESFSERHKSDPLN